MNMNMDHSTDNDGGDGKQLILSNNYNNNSRTQIRQMQRTQITQQPRQILDEEEYTDTLSHIVTRDYFPSLPSLRRDAAILDARSRGDISGAVAVRRMARKDEMEREKEWKEEMEHEREATTATSVTETSLMSYTNQNNNAKIHVRKRPRPLKHETITGFHSRVTSEDNAEFECNQERERKEREERLGVIYASHADRKGRLMIEACMNGTSKNIEEEESSNNNAARALLCDTPIGLSSDLYDAPPSAGLRITDSDGNDKEAYASNNGIGRNGLFFQPLHRSSNDNRTKTSSEKLLLTSSEGGPSSAGTFLALENNNNNAVENTNEQNEINDKSDNLLMPPPPSRLPASSSNAVVLHQKSNGEPSSTTNNAKSIDDRCQLVEYLPKPTLPDIYPPATRFPYQNESRLLAKNNNNTAYNRRGSIQSMGSFTDASETTDLDSSPRSLERERAAYQEARARENETFVAMTPLIYPGGGGGNGRNVRGESQSFGFEPNEPIMTWGDVQSTPLVLGNGAAVDARAETSSTSAADWEPTYPSSLLSVGNDASSESSSLPSFDVVDDNRREVMARRAEKGLLDRAKTYRSGSSNSNKRRKDDDDQSVRSSQSSRSITSTTPFDRKASLTPAARALLEASNNALQSKKKKSGSRLFQGSSTNPGASSSFGSSLRMSYTPSVSSSVGGKKKRSSSSSISSLRRAAGGATPRCHKA